MQKILTFLKRAVSYQVLFAFLAIVAKIAGEIPPGGG